MQAVVTGPGQVQVRWVAPAAARPGTSISGYVVRESSNGRRLVADKRATSLVVTGLTPGPHSFTVETVYSGAVIAGRSTPSSTVTTT